MCMKSTRWNIKITEEFHLLFFYLLMQDSIEFEMLIVFIIELSHLISNNKNLYFVRIIIIIISCWQHGYP